MASDHPEGQSGSIRITREEALSPRVDGLLQRQKSLLGDSEGHRDRGRRWFYQNWFIFMVAAALAGLAGWAILEPIFEDTLYLQGKINGIQLGNQTPQIQAGGEVMQLQLPTAGSINLDGQQIWLLKDVYQMENGSVKKLLNPSDLKEGQEIGVYVEYKEAGGTGLALARFVETSPSPGSSGGPNLQQLNARSTAASLLFFSIVGGLIGLAIGAVDGLVCRLPRRALLAGAVGLLVGFVGGFISNILASLAYMPLNQLALKQMDGGGPENLTAFGFTIQMVGRSLAWMLAGVTMGLGQGIALRSKRLVLYGFLGGIAGGLLGGLLFDPIDLLLLGPNKPSAHWSRLVGLMAVGACVGALIGLVELLARDAWLRMIEGPLAGKEFLIFKDRVNVGSSPRSDIYLFNDPQVAGTHAMIRTVGDQYEFENVANENAAQINGRRVNRTRLRHGDMITIGRTIFVFQQRQS